MVRLVKRGLMFSDGSQSHFWELWAGEYLLFCQRTRCGTKTRRSDLFLCYKSRLVLFCFFPPLFVSLARCTDTAFKSDRKVFNGDELGQLGVERLQRATRWLLKTRLKHQRRHQRRQTREVSSERQKEEEGEGGGWMILTGTVHLVHIFSWLHRLGGGLVICVWPHQLNAGQDFLLVSS